MSGDVSAIPNVPETNLSSKRSATVGIKSATPDLIIFNEAGVSVDAMSAAIFENIGGHEMINMLRHDTVNAQNLSFNLIPNSTKIAKTYSPLNLIGAPGTISEYFKNFPIRLDTHFPEGTSANNSDNFYIDRVVDVGALVLQVTAMEVNEQIEVQVLSAGQYLDDIIGAI